MSKPNFQFIIILLVCVSLTAGCIVQTKSSGMPSPTSGVALPISTSTVSPPLETETPPLPKLQLTYHAGSSIYSVDIGCLDAPQPCLGEPERLFTVGGGHLGAFFWSPDGQKVAYEYENDVFVSDWNGENKVKITTSPDYDGWPVWTPGGKYIVYETKDKDYSFIFLMSNPDGTNQDVFLTEKGLDLKGNLSSPEDLSWSPDGKKITFRANSPDAEDWTLHQIFIYDLEKDEITQITDADADSFTPSFSPDGEWIISTRAMMKHDLNGSLLVKISTQTDQETIIYQTEKDSGEWFWFSQWSPIGDWISFVMGGDIYIIRPDGTQLINVTQSPSVRESIATWRLVTKP